MKEIFQDIVAAASAPALWDRVLDRFNDEFGIAASCMFSVHAFDDMRMGFFWSRMHHDYFSGTGFDVEAFMASGNDQDDTPGYAYLFRNPPQVFYDECRLFGVEGANQLPPSRVRDVTNEMGLGMRVAAALNQAGPWLDGVFC